MVYRERRLLVGELRVNQVALTIWLVFHRVQCRRFFVFTGIRYQDTA
jgi:hypothetical protein